MPWIMQVAGFILLLIAIGVVLWLSFWLLLFLLAAAAGWWVLTRLQSFLLKKGILNPTPGVTPDEEVVVTIVEGDFKRIDEQKTPTE